MMYAFMITAAVALFFTHGLKVAFDASFSEWRIGIRQAFAKVQQSLTRLCFCWRKASDDLSREVASRMQARQLRLFRRVLGIFKYYLCFGTSIHITYQPTDSEPQGFVVILGYALALLADCLPQLVTERSIHLWFSCFMLLLDLYICPVWCSFEFMVETAVFLRGPILFLVVAYPRMPLVIFWTAVRMSCMGWISTANASNMPALGAAQMRYEMFFLLIMVFIAGLCVAHMGAECRREAETEANEERQVAVTALLDMTYDVVVELNSDFRTTKPELTLSSFLLRPSLAAQQHILFEDLLFDESDRALFRAQLCVELSTASSKEVVNLRMRDGNGNALPVELFGFRFHGSDWHARCILGVREFGDSVHRHYQGAQGEQLAAGADQSCGLEEEVVAVVDCGNNQLPILESSPAFSLKVMPVVAGSCFAPKLVHADRFVDELQEFANRHWNAEEADDDVEGGERQPEAFCVEFRRGPAYMQALCTPKMCDEGLRGGGADTGLPHQCRISLTFSQLLPMPLCSEGSSGGSSSASGRSARRKKKQGKGHGTPRASHWHCLEDRAPARPQGPPHEAGGRAVGATTCGRSLSL